MPPFATMGPTKSQIAQASTEVFARSGPFANYGPSLSQIKEAAKGQFYISGVRGSQTKVQQAIATANQKKQAEAQKASATTVLNKYESYSTGAKEAIVKSDLAVEKVVGSKAAAAMAAEQGRPFYGSGNVGGKGIDSHIAALQTQAATASPVTRQQLNARISQLINERQKMVNNAQNYADLANAKVAYGEQYLSERQASLKEQGIDVERKNGTVVFSGASGSFGNTDVAYSTSSSIPSIKIEKPKTLVSGLDVHKSFDPSRFASAEAKERAVLTNVALSGMVLGGMALPVAGVFAAGAGAGAFSGFAASTMGGVGGAYIATKTAEPFISSWTVPIKEKKTVVPPPVFDVKVSTAKIEQDFLKFKGAGGFKQSPEKIVGIRPASLSEKFFAGTAVGLAGGAAGSLAASAAFGGLVAFGQGTRLSIGGERITEPTVKGDFFIKTSGKQSDVYFEGVKIQPVKWTGGRVRVVSPIKSFASEVLLPSFPRSNVHDFGVRAKTFSLGDVDSKQSIFGLTTVKPSASRGFMQSPTPYSPKPEMLPSGLEIYRTPSISLGVPTKGMYFIKDIIDVNPLQIHSPTLGSFRQYSFPTETSVRFGSKMVSFPESFSFSSKLTSHIFGDIGQTTPVPYGGLISQDITGSSVAGYKSISVGTLSGKFAVKGQPTYILAPSSVSAFDFKESFGTTILPQVGFKSSKSLNDVFGGLGSKLSTNVALTQPISASETVGAKALGSVVSAVTGKKTTVSLAGFFAAPASTKAFPEVKSYTMPESYSGLSLGLERSVTVPKKSFLNVPSLPIFSSSSRAGSGSSTGTFVTQQIKIAGLERSEQKTFLNLKDSSKQDVSIATALSLAPAEKSGVATLVKVAESSKVSERMFPLTGFNFNVAQRITPLLRNISLTRTTTRTSTKLDMPEFTFETIKIPKPTPSISFNNFFKTGGSKDFGFKVLVRGKGSKTGSQFVSGSFMSVSSFVYPMKQALALGQSKVASTAKRSFKLVPSYGKLGSFSGAAFDSKMFKKKGNVFIEMSKFAIDTGGEKSAITYKGLATSKKLKGFRLFGFGKSDDDSFLFPFKKKRKRGVFSMARKKRKRKR